MNCVCGDQRLKLAFFSIALYFLIANIYWFILYVSMWVQVCDSTCTEVRGQHGGVGFLLLPCRFWGLNSGYLAWWQAAILTIDTLSVTQIILFSWRFPISENQKLSQNISSPKSDTLISPAVIQNYNGSGSFFKMAEKFSSGNGKDK